MKTLIALFLLIAATASAQYRYATTYFTLDDAIHPGAASNYNASVTVAQGNEAQLFFSYALHSTTNYIGGTNPVKAQFNFSIDGSHFTNSIYLAIPANSNNTVWGHTNFAVNGLAWIQLVNVTNQNTGQFCTNPVIMLGQKVGL